MEQSHLAFHQKVQQGFETLAAQHPERIVPIDAGQAQMAVTRQIQVVVEQYL
jgi:dTMP kinase